MVVIDQYRGHLSYDSWLSYRTYIDIVDRQSNKVIWQGEVVGRLSEEQQQNLQVTLQKTVSQMFSQFPLNTQP
jgi:hypothetical protein